MTPTSHNLCQQHNNYTINYKSKMLEFNGLIYLINLNNIK